MSPSANDLTARWASRLDDRQTVLSGAGVYPLLALLARFATGPARDELHAVAPTPGTTVDSPTTRLATGFWSRAGLPLGRRWRTELDSTTRGELTGDPTVDQPRLDRWAREHTDGLVDRMPVQVGPGTALVLANALTVLVDWATPFRPAPCQPTTGPWQGRPLAGLHRPGGDPTALRVADTPAGPISLLTVPGDADVDVLLALGPAGQPAARVLPAALGALDHPATLPTPAGPGVTEDTVEGYDDRPELLVRTVGFTVTGDHDLLDHADLFGLVAAGRDGDHFPDISPQLSVSDARQSARAEFTATGFRAAAVTAVGMRAGSAPPRATVRRRRIRLDVDRPFGFLAVHRPTGLVLIAGWVTDPTGA
ncbi:Serine protease inhibitor [Micromonospora matsumotoense]|uniref:Serine protease inhibitor n=1 Tax=Micromonospora matsumotoense TaxID=121616 RepID=A0A1C4VT26_9ACTN|nr:serpin family protein [Micromonospora matsumotoense]SCE87136.1 Serine protease inhibitor [Micromonospora matsumotoense]